VLAPLASLGIFILFGIVGYAVVSVTRAQRDETVTLLSPAVGAALIILVSMLINYLGVPIRVFALPLGVLLLALSIVVLVAFRIDRRAAPLWPIAVVLLAAFILAGWPLFEFGFDWLSYANGDMNTYVFGAARMFEHGFLVQPDARAYAANRDAVQTLFGLDVLYNQRSGAENLLAFAMGALKLDGYRAFMPLMLSLHLTLISAATAFACVNHAKSRIPLIVCCMLSVSPLLTLGTEYQLFGQVPGLALLIASLLLFCVPLTRPGGYRPGEALLAAIVLAAFAAVYPEMAPFLFLGIAALLVTLLVQRRLDFKRTVLWTGLTTAASACLLNVHLSTFLNMVWVVLTFHQGTFGGGLFPYYLVPSGLADFFGLLPQSVLIREPFLSLEIATGALLLLVSLFATFRLAAQREIVAFGMFALYCGAAIEFRNQSGFGLFKLAMYIQPFLVPTMVIWWNSYTQRVAGRS